MEQIKVSRGCRRFLDKEIKKNGYLSDEQTLELIGKYYKKYGYEGEPYILKKEIKE